MIQTGLVRLGRNAELRYTSDQTPVATLALAYNYGRKDDSGNQPTQWIDASLWGKRAEALAQYLTKGTQLSIILTEPHIETFKRHDNSQGSKLVARVLELEFAGSRTDSARAPQAEPAPAAKPDPQAAADNFDYDDDIPF